jgi:hypothetical protein
MCAGLALIIWAVTARGADEERAVQTFERLGATVRRDETRPGKPVVAVLFGIIGDRDDDLEIGTEHPELPWGVYVSGGHVAVERLTQPAGEP